MSILRTDGAARMTDGRTVTFAEYGIPSGRPVVWLHGLPGSRLDLSIGNAPAMVAELGLRVLAPDRPGFGGSTAHPGRSHTSFADDVALVADACAAERFAVIGYSAGAGYALACAAHLGERVESVAIVSGTGPRSMPRFGNGLWRSDKAMLMLSRWAPPVARAVIRTTAGDVRTKPADVLATLRKDFSSCAKDVALLDDRDSALRTLLAFREATEQGPGGCVSDWAVWGRAWDFDVARAGGRRVRLWHGDEDPTVPLHHAEYLQSRIPGAELTVWPGEGHLHDDATWREALGAL